VRRESRVAAVVVAAAVVVLNAITPPASFGAAKERAGIAALGEKWRWVTSELFEVLTNGPERRAREVIEELAAYRAAIRQMMGGESADPPQPIRILQFDRVWDFAPYQTLDAAGRPETFDGYFLSRGDLHYFALSNESGDQVPRTVLTGYAHVLISRQVGSLPPWLRTGLANYLSAYRYVARERRAEIGRPIPENMQYLNATSHYPLERVLRMDFDSEEFARDVPRSIFFAKSWLLVHYLQLGAPHRAGTLARYAQRLAGGEDVVTALEQAAGCPLSVLEDELAAYQKKSLMNLQAVDLAEDPRGVSVQARPATREEVAFRLGEYLAALGPERQRDADAHFAASGRPAPAPQLAAGSPPGQLVASEPRAASAPRRAAEPVDTRSLEELHAAVAAGGSPARDRELLARGIRELAARDWERAKTYLPVARQGLRELIVQEPRRQELTRELLWLYQAEQEPADLAAGIAALEQAQAAAPDASWLFAAWGELLLASGDFDSARQRATTALSKAGSAAENAAAQRLLVEIDAKAAEALRERGRGDEGRALLEARLAATTDPPSREFATFQLEAFRGALAAEAVEAGYRAAVALVNSQKVEDGERALREFIAAHPDSMWAEVARQDLEKVEAYLAKRRARGAPPSPPPASPPS
jgi:hypothetical protein